MQSAWFFSFVAVRRDHPEYPKEKKVIECSIENFVRMVTVMKQRVVPPGVFSSATGYCERGTEMENLLVKLVSEGVGRDASFSTLGARSVSAIRDVEHKIACEVIPPSLVTDAGGERGKSSDK